MKHIAILYDRTLHAGAAELDGEGNGFTPYRSETL